MPWGGSSPNKIFTRTDGVRSGATTWQEAHAAGVKIVDTFHDTHDEDIADSLNLALLKNGENTATAALPMGGFNHTNVGAATARTHYARFSDHQDQKGVYVPTVGGTANAITLTTGYSVDAYAAGQKFTFIAAQTNSSTATVAVDGLAAKNITGPAGATLAAGQILASALVTIQYDGTQFQLQTETPVAIPVGFVGAWPMTTVPSGWLECDGSAVSRSTYSALFNVYGTAYGVGDGSTTFNLPNYKDYFLRGFDASGTDVSGRTDRGDGTTGAAVGTKQAQATKHHSHAAGTLAADNATVEITYGTGTKSGAGGDTLINALQEGAALANDIDLTHGHVISGSTAATSGESDNESRPKNITVKWIVLALPGAALPVGSASTVSPRLCHTGGIPARLSTDGTNTTPSITETYIAEVFIPAPTTLTGISIFNGDAVAGNVAVALANSLGAVVASSGAVAQSGTDARQRVPFAASYQAIGPGTFYVLVQFSNTSARFNTHLFGDFGASKKTGETFGTFTTITPPTTFTASLGPYASLY